MFLLGPLHDQAQCLRGSCRTARRRDRKRVSAWGSLVGLCLGTGATAATPTACGDSGAQADYRKEISNEWKQTYFVLGCDNKSGFEAEISGIQSAFSTIVGGRRCCSTGS